MGLKHFYWGSRSSTCGCKSAIYRHSGLRNSCTSRLLVDNDKAAYVLVPLTVRILVLVNLPLVDPCLYALGYLAGYHYTSAKVYKCLSNGNCVL